MGHPDGSMRPIAPLLLVALLTIPLVGASTPPPSTWTVFTTVDAVVRDNYATVKVVADIQNRGPDPEFPFVVRVPDDAFVTGLTIVRDGTTYEAEIKDRETARQEYEEWKSQQQTGGLVEKTRRTSVYSYLINVAEFTSVTATLTYERYLAADRGVYNLSLEAPVSGFGRDLGARFSVTVRDSDGVVSLWGEPAGRVDSGTLTYEVGPRPGVESPTPFTASYMLFPTADAGTLLTTIVDGKGYFAHRFRAPADAKQLPMDLVMVLDVSGSMAGAKLAQMIDASKQVVAALDEDDRLHIVSFSSDARSAWPGLLEMTPANRKRAAQEIDALFDGGGTNIESGLRRGFTAFSGAQRDCLASASSADACGIDWGREEGRFPGLVLLTDGQPTSGITSRAELRQLAERLNANDIAVFGIAFGEDADFTLVRDLAQDGEGAAILVPRGAGAEVDLRRFMAALTTPVLRDVFIDYSDGVVASRAGAPTLFAGSELLVVGTFDPKRGISGTVTGWSPEGERRYDFDGGAPAALPFLPRLVAYQEVSKLQEQEYAGEGTSATTARIVELAERYGFVTDHTSLVLTLPAREWREFQPTPMEPNGDVRARSVSGSAAPSSGCASCTSVAPSSADSAGASSGGGWWPFSSKSSSSEEGMTTTDVAYEHDANAPPSPTAEPAVPGPGFALVVLAIVGAAFVAARRKR